MRIFEGLQALFQQLFLYKREKNYIIIPGVVSHFPFGKSSVGKKCAAAQSHIIQKMC